MREPTFLASRRGFSMIEVLMVMAIGVVIAAIATPLGGNALGFFRLSGDARSVSNSVAVAKMRAASAFSQARLFVDLTTGQHHIETYQKTGTPGWVWEGGATDLSTGVNFGLNGMTAPPPNTQAAIGQAPLCLDDDGNPIGNSACVVFNSRGIPVDGTGAPTAADAFYVTDGTTVYAVTVASTGMSQMWRTDATNAWTRQ